MNKYSVYDRRSDLPVIIDGTATQCAKTMGVTIDSFYTLYTKLKNGHKRSSRKWEIFRSDENDP